MFLYSSWRALSLPTRVLIAQQFGITKIGTTHVIGNEVVSDGYKVEDVERALNVDAIQAYTGSVSTDVNVLWDLMVAKVEGREVKAEPVENVPTVDSAKPKRKYTKRAKK